MTKRIFPLWSTMAFLLAVVLLVACGPNPEQSAVMTLTAAPLTSTNTPIPPTATATATPTPTDTPEPTPTSTNTPKPTHTPVPPSATPTLTELAPLVAKPIEFVYDGKQIRIERVSLDLEQMCTEWQTKGQDKGANCLWVELRLPNDLSLKDAIQMMMSLQNSHVIDQGGNRTVRQPDFTAEIGQGDSQVWKLLFWVNKTGTSFTLELPDGQQIPIEPNG
jgi:hypothetical protein